jgi:hypothetical protein
MELIRYTDGTIYINTAATFVMLVDIRLTYCTVCILYSTDGKVTLKKDYVFMITRQGWWCCHGSHFKDFVMSWYCFHSDMTMLSRYNMIMLLWRHDTNLWYYNTIHDAKILFIFNHALLWYHLEPTLIPKVWIRIWQSSGSFRTLTHIEVETKIFVSAKNILVEIFCWTKNLVWKVYVKRFPPFFWGQGIWW